MDSKYDIVIIGSGLGGLMTANFLAKKGHKVAILEKNAFAGGGLQSFKKHGVTFDTGIHYIGGLEKGQNLYKLFNYLNIFSDLKIRELDVNGFDHFFLGEKKFVFPKGYSNFQKTLGSYFPGEQEAIATYLQKLKDISNSFSLYNLNPIEFNLQNFYDKLLLGRAWDFIQSITKNTTLQNLLAAQNILYAGKHESTFLFVHALISNHYIEGAWRFVDGSNQVADALVNRLHEMGGEIFYNAKASKFVFSNDKIKSVVTENNQEIFGENFISAIHPYQTMEMIEPDKIRKSYRNRLQSLENTSSAFILYLVMKDGTIPYMNYNSYYYSDGNVWTLSAYDEKEFPQSIAIYPVTDSIDEKYTRGLSVMAYMNYNEVRKWENTEIEKRGEEYAAFKEFKAQRMIKKLEQIFPGIRKNIKAYISATPLTLRDYTGTHEGSLYGIERDYRQPNNSMLFPKTKVSNLYLTGQNLSLHGMLGVSMGALLTCSEFMDLNELLKEINHA